MPIVLKSGSLSLLEPTGPVQACNGIALPFTQSLLYFPKNAIYFEILILFFFQIIIVFYVNFKCSAPFGKTLSVVSTDLISAAIYKLKYMDHHLRKAGSDQQHDLFKIAPSRVNKAV